MKVSDLSGVMLDYWVAKALGKPNVTIGYTRNAVETMSDERVCYTSGVAFRPSRVWNDGGPIIEQELCQFSKSPPMYGPKNRIEAFLGASETLRRGAVGATYLEAAMRAFVRLKFDDEVPA